MIYKIYTNGFQLWVAQYKFMVANRITQATHACFFITFVIVLCVIFLQYVWNIFEKVFKFFFKFKKKNIHTILLRFMLKIWKKMSFS
jgi:hypothetical protein